MPQRKRRIRIETTNTHGYMYKGREKETFFEIGNAGIAETFGEALEKLGFDVEYDYVGDDK